MMLELTEMNIETAHSCNNRILTTERLAYKALYHQYFPAWCYSLILFSAGGPGVSLAEAPQQLQDEETRDVRRPGRVLQSKALAQLCQQQSQSWRLQHER